MIGIEVCKDRESDNPKCKVTRNQAVQKSEDYQSVIKKEASFSDAKNYITSLLLSNDEVRNSGGNSVFVLINIIIFTGRSRVLLVIQFHPTSKTGGPNNHQR